jgi:hypothetical protein
VSELIRSVRSATWTLVEPVSASCRRCLATTVCLSKGMLRKSSDDSAYRFYVSSAK